MKKSLAILSLFAMSTMVSADVEIDMQAPDGSVTTFWIGTERVKMATQDASGYVIVDIKDQKQYMIDHNEKMVIDVTGGLDGAEVDAKSTGATPNVSITKVGEGPVIAGFKSDKYEVKAEGVLCGVEYLSTEPFSHPEIVKLLKVMAMLSEPDIGNSELYQPCEQADLLLEKQYQTYGMPLKSLNAEGAAISEVVKFRTATPPAGTYDFPNAYQITTLRALIDEQLTNAAKSK